MCNFCENITNEVDVVLSNKYDGLALIRDEDNKFYIVQEFIDDYNELACLVSKPIKFCPMCSRKLSEETEKFYKELENEE